MKIRRTLLLLAVCAVVLTLVSTAQAVTVHNDTANGNTLPDLKLPNDNPLQQIGPAGVGDTNPFGPGTWDVSGAMDEVSLNDDGDGFNWSTTNTFDLSWSMPGGGFVRWSTGFDNWGAGGVSLDVNTGNVNGLAAGNYSGGGFESSPHNWTWQITVAPIPEPSTFALAGIGLAALGFVGWRKRKSRK